MAAKFEHINITLRDCQAAAKRYCALFDWHVRWEGEVLDGAGYSMHVGTADQYIALYSPKTPLVDMPSRYTGHVGLNHIGVVVDDLDAMEKRVEAAGYKIHNHADYEPGRRFYFDDDDGIEIEVISYSS